MNSFPLANRRSALVIALMGAMSAFAPLAIDMYLPAFEQIGTTFGVNTADVSLSLSAFLIGLACGQLLSGPLADRYGRKPPLMIGSLIFALAALASLFCSTFAMFLAVRFAMGLGGSVTQVVVLAVLRDLYDEQRAVTVISLMILISGIAPIVAPFFGGQLLVHFGWTSIFVFLGGFAIVCLLGVGVILKETLAPEKRQPLAWGKTLGTMGRLLINPWFATYGFAMACGAGLLFSYISGAPQIYLSVFDVPENQFGIYFGANAIGFVACGQLNSFLRRRFEVRALLLAAFGTALIFGILLLIGLLLKIFAIVIGALFFCIMTLGIILPNASATALWPFGKTAGTASSLLGVGQYGIGAAVGGLAGLFTSQNGATTAIAVIACALGGLLLIVFGAKDKNQASVGFANESASAA